MANGQIDKKYLAGLKFNTSEPKETEENGKKRTIYIPVERDLGPDDVLSWKEADGEIVIVAKDGKKHRVKASGKGPKGQEGQK